MIETNLVCKSFGTIRALDSVSTSIRSGAVYGIIGSNGAGKSTYLRECGTEPGTVVDLTDSRECSSRTAVQRPSTARRFLKIVQSRSSASIFRMSSIFCRAVRRRKWNGIIGCSIPNSIMIGL